MISRKLILRIFEGFSIQRWTDLVRPFDIVEMDKAGEKTVLAYLIGKYEEKNGVSVDWNWLMYAAFFDLLRKIALCDIKAPVQQLIRREYPQEYMRLNEWVLNQYRPVIGDDGLFSMFTIYIGQKAGSIPVPEQSRAAARILSAADKYATMREFQMLAGVNEAARIESVSTELLSGLRPYLDLTGLQMLMTRQRLFDFLMKIEQLRFQIRWNQTPRVPKTTVLGHCFFVAVVTLLLCRMANPGMCGKRAVNDFFSALFHDLPEAVTRDIISPVKQATDEFPGIVKRIEDEIVNKELVPLMEPFFAEEIMYYISDEFSDRILGADGTARQVSWEDLNGTYNSEEYSPVDGRIIRVADHLAALIEADSSIRHGITSGHLEYGRREMLETYREGTVISGIDAGRLFRDLIA